MGRPERRLAAILAADVVGYSRLMGTDEVGTLATLKAIRRDTVDPAIASHRGRIVKTTGDGLLVEFSSAVDAVSAAREIQQQLAGVGGPIRLRIGINVGDVIIDDDDIFGDGVNIAARVESACEPGGIFLSEDAWRQVRGKTDCSFQDLGERELKNIDRPVRLFAVRVEGEAETAGSVAAGSSTATISPPVLERPSIAVLPFQNMSGDPEQEHFCDGLVEDIITTLSKLSDLKVIARNSSFVYKGRSVDIREAAGQLGVRYILEGSVRRSGNRIRITAQLIDATDGTHVWAERYDRSMDDIFAIQDEITLVLATEMQVRLTEGEQARLHYTTTSNVEAWTCWVRGMSHHRKAVTREEYSQARLHWEKALALDPASATLNAKLAFLHSLDARFEWWDDRESAKAKARGYAQRALEIDPGNADACTASSLVLLFDMQHDEAAAAARKAVQMAPGAADTAELASHVLSACGFPEEAIVMSERAMALSPNYPAVYLGTLGNAYRLAGRTEQAIATFRAYHARNPGFGLTDIVIACELSGRHGEAVRTARELLLARPNFTVAGWLHTQVSRRDTAQVQADAAALRAAGLL